MASQEMSSGKRGGFAARISVEAIVVVLVVSATIGILTVKAMTGGWEDPPTVSGKAAGLRHDAISAGGLSDGNRALPNQRSANIPPHLGAAGGLSDGNRALPNSDIVVRNGITVVSPPLLVPFIEADAAQTPNGSEIVASPRKASITRKRSHYSNRAHPRSQRRIVRSDPFSRFVAR